MPCECCAVGCNYRLYFIKNHKLVKSCDVRSLYRIPKDTERRHLWLAAINRKTINPDCSRICSAHFISGNVNVLASSSKSLMNTMQIQEINLRLCNINYNVDYF